MMASGQENRLLAGVILFAGLSGLLISLYLNGEVAVMDQAAIALAASLRTDMGTAFFQLLTYLGGGFVLAPLGAVLVIGCFLKGYRREAVVVLVTLLSGEVFNDLLKAVFARPRPVGVHVIDLPDSYSFPSGHSMISPVFYGMIGYLLVKRYQEKRWSGIIQPVAFLLAVLIGLSRVYLGVHFLSDVLTGLCLSMVLYFLIRFGYGRWVERSQDPVRPIVHSR